MKGRKHSRREFLGAAALAAPALLTRCGRAAERPNILFCISDDQSYPHAGVYGASWIRTPAFDRIAGEGVVFTHAFVSAPSCCPSRGSVLTGQEFYRLREASMNHTVWPSEAQDLPLYTDLLAGAGYHVGYTGKGWGPGNWRVAGRETNPAGPAYNEIRCEPPGKFFSPVDYAANFEAFLGKRPKGAPFCFWAGFSEPHRRYDQGIGVRHGIDAEKIDVPGFLPDAPEVRSDLADYAFEIQYYDGHLARMLEALDKAGELENTLIVVTSDNGMPFPRAKASLYDYGTRMPLAIRWGARVKPGRRCEDFVRFPDFAPTFLEAAGLSVPEQVTGRSLLPVLEAESSGRIDASRDHAVFGIERHLPGARAQGGGYPIRAIRTREFLYIRNLKPEATPCGDNPGPVWPENDPTGGFGDVDGGPAKTYIWEHRKDQPQFFEWAFAKRPAEELYEVAGDPFNLTNLAADDAYADQKRELAARLDEHLKRTADPRATGRAETLEEVMRRFPVLGSNRGTPQAKP